MTFQRPDLRRGPSVQVQRPRPTQFDFDFADFDPSAGGFGGLSDTHRALSTMFSRLPDPLYFPGAVGFNGLTDPGFRTGTSRLASTARGGGTFQPVGVQPGEEEEVTPVPGPLGIWEDDKGRPHQQTGKFGANLLGTAGPGQPGAPTAYQPAEVPPEEQLRALAAPDNPDNSGFWQGLLGTVGGIFGEVGHNVGSAIGSGVDLPFEAVGNVAGLPLSAVSSAQYLANRDGKERPFNPLALLSHVIDPTGGLDLYISGGLEPEALQVDDDLAAIYREAAEDNPINGLLMMGQLAKAQWQRDVEQGRRTGLMQDIGPATAVTDQLGVLLSALSVPQRALVRGVSGYAGTTEASLKAVEQAVRTDDISELKNSAFQRLAQRLDRGDFGPIGSQQARDAMLDTLIAEGSVLRDVGDVEQVNEGFNPLAAAAQFLAPAGTAQALGFSPNQALPFNMTFQGLADMAFSLATDPLILADFGVAGVARGAKAATMAANTRVWGAIPAARRAAVSEAVEEVGMRMGGFADKERVWDAIGRSQKMPETVIAGSAAARDGGFEMRVLNEVMDRPEFADIAPAAREQIDAVTRYRTVWEPRLRPIKTLSNTINDPFRLFGVGTGDRALGSVFDAHTTEGNIRGAGSLDAHAELQDLLDEAGGDFRRNYDRGLGIETANLARSFFRNGLIKDLRRKARNSDIDVIPFTNPETGAALSPSEVIEARMHGGYKAPGAELGQGVRGRDIATAMEQHALRVRPQYLAAERGGAGAALLDAQRQAAHRLQLMGMDAEQATALSSRMNRDHVSLLDASYFGFSTDAFTVARDKAIKKGVPKNGIDPEALTILGPRQMTVQSAEELLEALGRGDMTAMRQAMGTYDILYENFSLQMDEDKLVAQIKALLTDQIEANTLPRDLDSLTGLDKGLRRWAEDNAELGYRPGFRPTGDDAWRATVDRTGPEPKIIGVNPWIELVGTAADVPTYNRLQRARSLLFHNIRGERIMADARVRLAHFVTDEWGGTKGDSDALFARFIQAASEAGVTPRAMSPKQIYNIVSTQKMTVPLENIGMHNAVEALMHAFEGNWKHVGTSQKFTGAAKTVMGGQTNWIGQMAERVYPLTRFTLNPLFQVQELVEPFVMNTARGIKPGFKPSDLDTKTIGLVESMIRDGRYAFDDQIERSEMLLWGLDAANNAFKPGGRAGRLLHRLTANGRLNVQKVKRVNYARALRANLGREMQDALERVSPEKLVTLPRHYGTSDWGEIAVRYLTEKGRLTTPDHVLKPSRAGLRGPVNLDKVVDVFDDIADSAQLRAATASGSLTLDQFRDTLKEAGADDDFIERAYHTASQGFDMEAWWADYRTNVAGGNQRQTSAARTMYKGIAARQGMSEAEWIAKYMGDHPMVVDSAALASLSPADKRHVRLMAEMYDLDVGMPAEVEDVLTQFRRDKRFTDREHFAVVADDGTVIARAHQYKPWRILSNGTPTDAGLGGEISEALPLVEGNWMIHNHPSPAPYSPADIVTGVEFNAKGNIVESPGISYTLMPDPDEGWMTEAWIRDHGEVPDRPDGRALYYDNARQNIHAEWWTEGQTVMAELANSPFYADATGEQWDGFLEQIATNTAVQRIADRYGWKYSSREFPLLPADPVVRHEVVRDFLQNPPPGLKAQNPYAFNSAPGIRHDAKAGAALPLGLSRRDRPWLPEGLDPAVEGQIMAGWEQWARSRVAPLFGTAITDVARGTDNAVWDAWGTAEQIEDLSNAMGFLLRQDEVASTRVKPGAAVARPAAGERWSLNVISDEWPPDVIAAEVERAMPEVAAWGRPTMVRTADGRTAMRYVWADQPSDLSRGQFRMESADLVERDWPVAIEVRPEVVDFRQVSTDWETAGAEGYLAGLRTRRPDVVAQLEHGLAEESEAQLAHLARAADPGAVNAHIARLRAAGESVPDFRVPGEYRPTPVAERLTVTLPGGRERFFDGETTLSLWEQQGLKSQRINALDLYSSDPDLYVNLMKAIWRSKDRALDSDVERQAFNLFAFGALTSNAALDVTEGAFALMRAQTGTGVRRGIRGAKVRAERIAGFVPERYRDNPSHLGIAFQLDEQLRLPSVQTRRANWLTPEQRTDIDALTTSINERMRNATVDEREALAKRIQTEVNQKGLGNLVSVHPFRINPDHNDALFGNLEDFVSLPRPNMRMKGSNTSRTWGRVIGWLTSGIFDSESTAVQRFLRIQPGESRATYGLRMSSLLPGIDTKTALMSMQGAGPSALTHGAMDTHGVRFTAQSALNRGDLGTYWRSVTGVDFVPSSDAAAFQSQTLQNTRNWNLSPHTPEEFAANKVYVTPEGDSGFMVTPDGDLQNVFNNSPVRGAGKAAVERAVAEGATTLDAYDGFLPGYYSQFGFRETGRMKFVDEYAPEGWDFETQGRPDVVFMARTGRTEAEPSAAYFDDWDEAKAASREAVNVPEPTGLLDRLTPAYADKLRRALQSGTDAFPSPESNKVFLVPAGMRDKPWSPAKARAMRERLHLIPDPEMRALYDDDEVLRYAAETGGKVNTWGGDYAVMEDYFSTVLRDNEVAKLRAAGHEHAAATVEAMSGAEWQWFKWDHIRSDKGTPLDPHVGITLGADTIPPRTGGELDRAIRVQRLGSPYDPHMGALFQQIDGKIMGATQMADDGRHIIMATQHADSRTGMHELAHVLESHLDPSMRDTVLAQFREVTGSKRQVWNRDVSEWWADEFVRYIRGGSKRGMDPTLRSSFEYFRKTIDGVEATMKARAAEQAQIAGRTSAINRATKAVARTADPAKQLDQQARAAMRVLEARNRELRRARGRAGIADLESKAAASRDEVMLADQNLRDAKAEVRAAKSAVREAEVRAKAARGTRSAGGARAGVNRKIAAVEAAEAEVDRLNGVLTKARQRSTEANRKVAGAKRRTPLDTYIKSRDAAKKEADKVSAKAKVAQRAADDARAALDEAKAIPTKPPKVRVERPTISDGMQALFDDILRPKVEPDTKWGPGSPIDGSAHFNLQEEAVYEAAQLALSRAEENAFTLHYYKRGRSLVERSINHPYFGLYPASYMWGKVLPELMRFLMVKPFGLDAPLGGLLLANNIYRQTLMQQQYNEDFRKTMLDNTDAFHMLSLLLPASPWEVPVNAPLWMRRFAENGLTYEDKLRDLNEKYGDQPIPDEEMPPMMDLASGARTVRDMLSYAFVPAVEQFTGGAGTIFGAADETVRGAATQIEGVLRGAPEEIPEEPTGTGVPALPAPGTLPTPAQGYQP
jgi:hypothetical protein